MGRNSYVVLAFHQIILITLGGLALNFSGSAERIFMWLLLVIIIEAITRYSPWILGRKKEPPFTINKDALRAFLGNFNLSKFTDSSK